MEFDPSSLPENYVLSDPLQQEDGSDVYEIHDADAKEEKIEKQQVDFNHNLAEYLPLEVLSKIAMNLGELVQEDLTSREVWLNGVNKVKDYLGFSIEDVKNIPFPNATRTFDTTLSTSLIRFYATMRSEFFPDDGPVHIKLSESGIQRTNEEDPDLEQIDKFQEEVKAYLNTYLTTEDKDYYSDCSRSLIYLGFYGSIVKKIFLDPNSGKVLSRFIIPDDFIVNNDCLSLLESERLTHVLKMSERDILALEKSGYYKKYDQTVSSDPSIDINDHSLKKDVGIDTSSYNNKTLKIIYECHAYLSLKSFVEGNNFLQSVEEKEVTLPYIVTFNPETKKILRLTRNWEPDDVHCRRINYFVNYQYLPGFGIYGLGLAHLLGTNAIALTKILRQLIDAGSFKNFPGGLRQKGVKEQKSDITVGPGQFIEVDVGGRSLQDVFMPLPYSDPSQTLMALRTEIIQQTRELAATAELKMNDQNPNAPVGTTLAMLEVNQKIQSAIFKGFYFSLSEELNKIFNLLKSSRGIFNETDRLDIVPVADPALDSKTHKLIKAESLLKVASQFPDLYNVEEINKRYCRALGIDEIEKIFQSKAPEEPPPPLDPITENMRAIKNEPVKAYVWQDHQSHIAVHSGLAEENQSIQAHIAEHSAFAYLMQMQQKMGFEMPPEEELANNPDLQNQIAYKAASVSMKEQEQQQQQAAQPVDPKAEALKEIAALENQQKMIQAQLQYEQKMAEIASREKIEDSRSETAVFKSQLDFEKEMAKIDAEKEIHELKEEKNEN